MSIIRIYIYATVIHFERQLLTDLPKQKKKKKEKNPLPNLVGKSAAHSHPSSHFSISLTFHEQHPQSFPFLFPSFFLSIQSFLFSFSSTVHRANNVFQCGRDLCPRVFQLASLSLSFPFVSLSLSSTTVTVIWRCMGGLFSLPLESFLWHDRKRECA